MINCFSIIYFFESYTNGFMIMWPILDKHAPLKKICIVDRPMNDWINADIQALKVIRRNKEDIWRKNPIVINFQIYQESCLAVKNAINESKTKVIQKKIC